MYVYLPRLQRSLSEFVAARNNHRVSTEENKTPSQMFWTNIHLSRLHSGMEASLGYGVNVNNLTSSDIPHVEVPDIETPISATAFGVLERTSDPLGGDNGKEIYLRVVEFVSRQMVA